MRRKDYLSTREAEMVQWTGTFESRIRTGYASYGLAEVEAQNYKTTRDRFIVLYNQANDETTRTRVIVMQKNEQKRTLINATRMLVRVCEAWPQMTNSKRVELGIPEKNPRPAPLPAPTTEPYVKVESVVGRRATIVLQSSKTNNKRPIGATGANIFVAFGNEMPTEVKEFQLLTGTTRARNVITFDTTDAATTAWISACWLNGRRQSGPACDPVAVELAAVRVKPQQTQGKLRKAA